MQPYLQIDLTDARRVLTFGDVHGHLDILIAALRAVDFDENKGDVLIGLGDWLDRGPAVLEIQRWITERKPGSLHFVRGNHEEIVLEGLRDISGYAGRFHRKNGGGWTRDFVDKNNRPTDEIMAFAKQINAAPVVIEARTPGGNLVGFAHADLPGNRWSRVLEMLDDPGLTDEAQSYCMWQRERIRSASHDGRVGVGGIDHVFFGHTIHETIVTHQNCSWIDTGADKHGCISVIDVDQFLDELDSASAA